MSLQRLPRLIIKAVLESKFEGMLALVGLVCSSMVMVNAGTSRRDFLLPMGDPEEPTVAHSNLMACRCFPGLNQRA